MYNCEQLKEKIHQAHKGTKGNSAKKKKKIRFRKNVLAIVKTFNSLIKLQ